MTEAEGSKPKVPAIVQKQAERLIPGGPLGRAAASALQRALTDPEVQKRINDQSSKLVRKAQDWQAERRAEPAEPGSARAVLDGMVGKVTSRFGQDGLTRRVIRVRESIDIVEEARPVDPGVASSFEELRGECDRVAAAIAIAGRLTVVKRKRAQHMIDQRLSELEDGLLRHVLEPGG
jgi:hypothetical protein